MAGIIGATLFSGIGAPECAAPEIDWRWSAEIDRFPSAVLTERFPNVPNLGDVTKVEWDAAEPVQLLVAGSPCQSFSVAGKRLGLDDPRGNLALVTLAVARQLGVRWLVFENVPGLLSSEQGRDFGAFLGLLGECGYGWAYRVLDAQHFGVPQRRRRVFVVGYLGDWRRAASVLFEPESLSGHSPPRREAGERVARPIAAGSPDGSGYRNDADTADNLIAATLRGHPRPGSNSLGAIVPPLTSNPYGDHESREGLLVAHTLNHHHGRIDGESETFIADTLTVGANQTSGFIGEAIAHSLRADGFDASEDGTGRGTPIIPILEIGKGSSSRGVGPNGSGIGQAGDPMFTLQAGAQHAVATLTSNGDAHSGFKDELGLVPMAFSWQSGGDMRGLDLAESAQLQREQTPAILASAVRRLTPRECERLQGFPDDWTAITYRGKPAADGPRYKALGNSMAVPVLRWILGRLRIADAVRAAA